ncbi:MAG TPA: nucleotidyltransferase family protein [Bryobacteraceae bacterium]|nr:nucleotidyltransferase family protein [Bryobacteraceae bacterium]
MSPAGVILAAGASSRMGTPKALLEYEGETFLDRWIRLFASVCDPVIVVLGFDAERIRSRIRRAAETNFALNPDPARGMLSSLQTGLRNVPAYSERVLFTLVDHPKVSASTIAAVAADSAQVVIPVYDGERGHPVSISRQIMEEMLQLRLEASPKDVMHRHKHETHFLNAGDPGVLADIDDPESYAALLVSPR